ncbi:MAG: hypothetical protein K1X89_24810 [Myxococcaceae bacterium]|nr:hypothetical protein [Myxococcaceae bacterium]
MKPWVVLGKAPGEEGKELVLSERDGTFVIRAGGLELMSSARHGSEEAMADLALQGLTSAVPSVLIGGLGLGYTLRATLDRLPSKATVVVCEISKAVADWNRGPLAKLHQDALSDPRVHLEVGDAGRAIANRTKSLDAILLDADNGPSALTLRRNQELYEYAGLARAHQALKLGGSLVVWSASPDPRFMNRLEDVGFDAHEERVPVREGKKAVHVLFVGKKRLVKKQR